MRQWDGKRNESLLRGLKSQLGQRIVNTVGFQESQGGLCRGTQGTRNEWDLKKERMKMKATAGDADGVRRLPRRAQGTEAKTRCQKMLAVRRKLCTGRSGDANIKTKRRGVPRSSFSSSQSLSI